MTRTVRVFRLDLDTRTEELCKLATRLIAPLHAPKPLRYFTIRDCYMWFERQGPPVGSRKRAGFNPLAVMHRSLKVSRNAPLTKQKLLFITPPGKRDLHIPSLFQNNQIICTSDNLKAIDCDQPSSFAGAVARSLRLLNLFDTKRHRRMMKLAQVREFALTPSHPHTTLRIQRPPHSSAGTNVTLNSECKASASSAFYLVPGG